jgi:hypothetical protein
MTHNEYVWIEHIHICRYSDGYIKETSAKLNSTVSQQADDKNTTTQDASFDIAAGATTGKVDKPEKTAIFRADNKAEIGACKIVCVSGLSRYILLSGGLNGHPGRTARRIDEELQEARGSYR